MAMSKYPVETKTHLDGAIANLQAARESLEAGQYETAASRAAEAAFHTGSMLLLDEEIEPVRHGNVITLLQEVFVNKRRLTKEQGGNLSWLFALRNTEDRGAAAPVTPEEARKALEIAESFFEAAKVILEGRRG
jgi:uncharacterized protein (UPF0332 family)